MRNDVKLKKQNGAILSLVIIFAILFIGLLLGILLRSAQLNGRFNAQSQAEMQARYAAMGRSKELTGNSPRTPIGERGFLLALPFLRIRRYRID